MIATVGSSAETVTCSKMMTFSMKMLSFRRHEASKMEPERVPGSSYLAMLWMAGCGQWAMGDIECDMAVPRRDDRQTSALAKTINRPG